MPRLLRAMPGCKAGPRRIGKWRAAAVDVAAEVVEAAVEVAVAALPMRPSRMLGFRRAPALLRLPLLLRQDAAAVDAGDR